MNMRAIRAAANTFAVVFWIIVALATLSMAMGCAVGGALYKDEHRSILPVSFEGSPTFCWEGLDMSIVDIRPLGWGPDECNRTGQPPSPD